jgi:hypothetical protein
LTLHPSDLRAGDWLHLIEIDYEGQTVRLAEEPVSGKPWGPLSASVDFFGGLDIGTRFDLEIDLFADTPADRALSATLDLASVVSGFAARALDGGSLLGARARVYLHPVGTTQRFVVFRGAVTSEEFGADVEPVTISASSDPGEDYGTVHDPSDTIRSFDVIDIDEEQIDSLIPVVFGRPGAGSLTSPNDHFFGTPGFWIRVTGVSEWRIVAANSRTAAGEAGDPLFVWNVTQERGEYENAELLADDTGKIRTVIDLGSWTTHPAENGDEIWVDWNRSSGGISRYGGDAVRGAGDVLFWLASRVRGVDLDMQRIASLAPLLNKYKIDAGIWDPDGDGVSPLEWAQEYILPILPISLVDGPDGAHFVLWRPDASRSDAVAVIDTTINASRAGEVESSRLSGIANDITFKYGVDAKTEKPTRSIRVTGRQDIANTIDTARLGLYAQRSSQTFGHRQGPPVVAPAIWDDATATACLTWLERRFALPSHSVSYSVRPDLAWLSPGDVVALTDPDIGVSDRVCLVEVVSPSRSGDVLIRVRLYSNV